MILDYLTCDYDLPIPEDLRRELGGKDWSGIEFQTYSFAIDPDDDFIGPNLYNIESDGQLYKELTSIEYVENEDGSVEIKPKNEGIERMEYTGEVLFSHLVMAEDKDHYLDFLALFW